MTKNERRLVQQAYDLLEGRKVKLYSTKEAAAYLNLSVSGVKHYVYIAKKLKPIKKGNSLVFTQEQLDILSRRKPGRPRKEQ